MNIYQTKLDLELENAELRLQNLRRVHAIAIHDREDARLSWIRAIDDLALAAKAVANLPADAAHEEHTLEILNLSMARAEHDRWGGQHAMAQLNVLKFAAELTDHRIRLAELREKQTRVASTN